MILAGIGVKNIAVFKEGLGFDFWAGLIGHFVATTRYCFNVSVLPRRYAAERGPPLVTCSGVVRRDNEDLVLT